MVRTGYVARWAVLLSIFVSALVGPSPNPAAADPFLASGAIQFSGTAHLEWFPCPNSCEGWFEGNWSGNLEGTDFAGESFTVSWQTVDFRSLRADFFYEEDFCALPGGGTATGDADGFVSGIARSSEGEVVGQWVPRSGLPRPIREVYAASYFQWARAGNSAAFVLRTLVIWFDVDGLGGRLVVYSPQRGGATFVPTHSDSPTAVPSCDAPLRYVEGEISGGLPVTHPNA